MPDQTEPKDRGMKLTAEQLRNLGYEERNGEWHKARGAASGAEPEPVVRAEPVAAAAGETCDAGRVRVSIVSFRPRLCDPDNLCPKYFIDCLRYAGLIADDTPECITLEVRQLRCRRAEQRTEILIT
jgi:hypothetical protein